MRVRPNHRSRTDRSPGARVQMTDTAGRSSPPTSEHLSADSSPGSMSSRSSARYTDVPRAAASPSRAPPCRSPPFTPLSDSCCCTGATSFRRGNSLRRRPRRHHRGSQTCQGSVYGSTPLHFEHSRSGAASRRPRVRVVSRRFLTLSRPRAYQQCCSRICRTRARVPRAPDSRGEMQEIISEKYGTGLDIPIQNQLTSRDSPAVKVVQHRAHEGGHVSDVHAELNGAIVQLPCAQHVVHVRAVCAQHRPAAHGCQGGARRRCSTCMIHEHEQTYRLRQGFKLGGVQAGSVAPLRGTAPTQTLRQPRILCFQTCRPGETPSSQMSTAIEDHAINISTALLPKWKPPDARIGTPACQVTNSW